MIKRNGIDRWKIDIKFEKKIDKICKDENFTWLHDIEFDTENLTSLTFIINKL